MTGLSKWTLAAALTCGTLAIGRAQAADDGPNAPPPPRQDGGPGGAGQGGPGGGGGRGGPQAGYHLIPRFAMDRLDLTDDQKKQLDELEKEVKEKLSKILTADQMKTLETARPPRGGPGRGGPGGGGPGGPGGGGGQGGAGGGGQAGPGGDGNGPPPRP